MQKTCSRITHLRLASILISKITYFKIVSETVVAKVVSSYLRH